MIKNDLRLFWSAFFMTLLLSGWLTVFFFVDSTSAQYEGATADPALGLTQTSELRYDLDLLGNRYTLYLDQFNQLEQWRKEYACLLTPRPILALEQLYSISVYGTQRLYNMYKEYEYQQNTQDEHPAIP